MIIFVINVILTAVIYLSDDFQKYRNFCRHNV